MDGNKTKDLDHVEAGLKAYVSDSAKVTGPTAGIILLTRYSAMHNDNLSAESQFAAAEKLGEIKK